LSVFLASEFVRILVSVLGRHQQSKFNEMKLLETQDTTMKVLIRNTVTGFYLAEGGGWVETTAAARDFERAPVAVLCAGDLGLRNIDLVYAFPHDEGNFNISLAGSGANPQSSRLEG
jgi:hypothetical protein